MKISIFTFLLLIIALLQYKCSDPVSVPPDVPIETLLSAPDTLIIENQSMILTSSLWRDFQPISPPNGKPMIALVYIETTDSSLMPSSINSDAIYIVYNSQIWKSFFSAEERPPSELKPFRITKIAREGPKWGPFVYVDVIVRIVFGEKSFLLRASEQYIYRTD